MFWIKVTYVLLITQIAVIAGGTLPIPDCCQNDLCPLDCVRCDGKPQCYDLSDEIGCDNITDKMLTSFPPPPVFVPFVLSFLKRQLLKEKVSKAFSQSHRICTKPYQQPIPTTARVTEEPPIWLLLLNKLRAEAKLATTTTTTTETPVWLHLLRKLEIDSKLSSDLISSSATNALKQRPKITLSSARTPTPKTVQQNANWWDRTAKPPVYQQTPHPFKIPNIMPGQQITFGLPYSQTKRSMISPRLTVTTTAIPLPLLRIPQRVDAHNPLSEETSIPVRNVTSSFRRFMRTTEVTVPISTETTTVAPPAQADTTKGVSFIAVTAPVQTTPQFTHNNIVTEIPWWGQTTPNLFSMNDFWGPLTLPTTTSSWWSQTTHSIFWNPLFGLMQTLSPLQTQVQSNLAIPQFPTPADINAIGISHREINANERQTSKLYPDAVSVATPISNEVITRSQQAITTTPPTRSGASSPTTERKVTYFPSRVMRRTERPLSTETTTLSPSAVETERILSISTETTPLSLSALETDRTLPISTETTSLSLFALETERTLPISTETTSLSLSALETERKLPISTEATTISPYALEKTTTNRAATIEVTATVQTMPQLTNNNIVNESLLLGQTTPLFSINNALHSTTKYPSIDPVSVATTVLPTTRIQGGKTTTNTETYNWWNQPFKPTTFLPTTQYANQAQITRGITPRPLSQELPTKNLLSTDHISSWWQKVQGITVKPAPEIPSISRDNLKHCRHIQQTDFCHSRYSGHYKNPSDCKTFLVCDWGLLYHCNCPDGTVYDPKIKVCNWDYATDCQNV